MHKKKLILSVPILVLAVWGLFNYTIFMYEYQSPAGYTATNYSNPITAANPMEIRFAPRYKGMSALKLRFLSTGEQLEGKYLVLSLYGPEQNLMAAQTVYLDSDAGINAFQTFFFDEPLARGQYVLVASSPNLGQENGVRVMIGTATASEVDAWYYGGVQEVDVPEFWSVYHRVSLPAVALCVLFLAAMAAAVWLPPFQKRQHRLAYHLVLAAAAPALVLYCVERLNSGNALGLGIWALMLNYTLYLGLFVLLYAVCNRFSVAVPAAAGVLLAGGIVNHYVVLYRKTIILPADIYGIKTAAGVMGRYQLRLTLPVFIAVLCFFALLYSACKNPVRVQGWKWRIATGGAALMLVAAMVTVVQMPQVLAGAGIGINYFTQTETSRTNGMYLNFALNVADMRVQAPAGYSQKQMEEDFPLPAASALPAKPPHVIVIMNESLVDYSMFGTTGAGQDVLPFIHSLAAQPNASVGRVVVPVFGANTSCTEFESLTGFSLGLGYYSNAPFSQLVKRDIPSWPRYMASLGYHTLGTHPAAPDSWSRSSAYGRLGFDEISFIDQYSQYESFNGLVTDNGMYDYIIDYYTQNHQNPLFIFGVTIQNHGGYNFDAQPAPGQEIIVEDTQHVLETSAPQTYLNMVRKSDAAFEKLVQFFESQPEPTVIVMFGDHWPALEESYYNMVLGKSKEELQGAEILDYYTTPLIVWNNYGADFTSLPSLLSINYVPSMVKQAVGLPYTAADAFLQNLRESYPVVSVHGVLDADDTLHTDMADIAELDLYKKLVYDGLFNTRWSIFTPTLPLAG